MSGILLYRPQTCVRPSPSLGFRSLRIADLHSHEGPAQTPDTVAISLVGLPFHQAAGTSEPVDILKPRLKKMDSSTKVVVESSTSIRMGVLPWLEKDKIQDGNPSTHSFNLCFVNGYHLHERNVTACALSIALGRGNPVNMLRTDPVPVQHAGLSGQVMSAPRKPFIDIIHALTLAH
jgi:hypothetical protein